MDDNSLKSGKCPKCGSQEVYTDKGNVKSSERSIIPITGWSRLFLDLYICTSCGYFEEYAADNDIKDVKKIEKIKKNWKRV